MKKIISLGLIIIIFPAMLVVWDKVEAPEWTMGDKWVFTQGNIEAVGANQNSYIFNFSKDISILENAGFERIGSKKSTLKRISEVKAIMEKNAPN